MARLIDADALMNTLQKLLDERQKEADFAGNRYVNIGWNDAIYHIKIAPTVDAVPVVRCRECKYHNKPRLGFCEMHLVRTNGNDFCSYGERKGGDE